MAGGAALGGQLLEAYRAVGELTASLVAAVEIDRTEMLDQLIAERATHLHAADQAIASLGQEARRLPPALHERITGQLQDIQAADRRLRALLSARSHEVPVQLAQVRRSRAALGSYGPSAPGRPELVDRRG
ncbi:MAG: flagellar protein FliT [Chloroflexi bacterium]|nr:flagellar protein FliT [Chloroflexota bacterium]